MSEDWRGPKPLKSELDMLCNLGSWTPPSGCMPGEMSSRVPKTRLVFTDLRHLRCRRGVYQRSNLHNNSKVGHVMHPRHMFVDDGICAKNARISASVFLKHCWTVVAQLSERLRGQV